MQMPDKTIKKIAILQTMDAIKFTDSSRDRAIPRPLLSQIRLPLSVHQGEFVLSRNINLVKEVARVLDISRVMVYNRFH
jgi:hypothetical protein